MRERIVTHLKPEGLVRIRKRKHLNKNNSCASVRLVRIVNRVRKSICDRCMCGMRMREAGAERL